MITIVGHDLWRGGEKIGWLSGNDIYNHAGEKLGYFSGNKIFSLNGRELGYLEGDYLFTSSGEKTRLENNRHEVSGGTISDLARAAIHLLLGE